MLKRLLFVPVCLGWLVLAVSAPAQADGQRAGDPPPMLTGAQQLQLIGAAAVVVIGAALVVWSLIRCEQGRAALPYLRILKRARRRSLCREGGPALLTRPGPGRAATSSRRDGASTPAGGAGTRE
jgi:hypothetical protein